MSGTLLYGEDFMALSQELSKTVGTMKALPKWVLEGAVVGIVGGVAVLCVVVYVCHSV